MSLSLLSKRESMISYHTSVYKEGDVWKIPLIEGETLYID